MNSLVYSEVFSAWLKRLRDQKGKGRILARLRSATFGNLGDCEFVGEGVFEMRIHFGAGYRVYYTQRGPEVYLLLVGGDKGTQKRDISKAIGMARRV
ncbi:MAG: type II toxin-antitoxin system RelE/ParE family toxin [Gammaproteobacteria bacterium]